MPISRTLFTLLLLLVPSFAIFSLSGDLSIKTAIAIHENIELDNPRNLKLGSNDQFALPEESSMGFVSQGGGNSDSNLYENSDYGIRMPYPSDWQESPPAEEMEGLEVQIKPVARQDVYFAISVFATDPGTTQEDLNNENLQLFNEQGYKIVQSGPMAIAGGTIPAFFIDYENYEEESKITIVSILMNDLEYFVEYGGTPQAYDRYLSLAKQIVDSIDISGFDQGGQFAQQGSGGGVRNSNSNFLEYSNPNLGFRIGYPAQAEIAEGANNVKFEMDLGVAGVSVTNDIGVELDSYSDSRIGEIRDSAEGFHVISSEESTLSGNPAHFLVYSTQENDTILRTFALWTISDNSAYNLVFIAPVSTAESFIPVALDMIDTFEAFHVVERDPTGEPEQGRNNGSSSGFRS
jgi:hypothetical protein